MDLLNDFTVQVVVCRRETGIRKWTRWLRQDLGAGSYSWLRPDFVPPSPFLVVKDPRTEASRILVEPHLIDVSSVKPGCPFSVGLATLSTLISFWLLFVICCLRNLCLIFLVSWDGDLQEVARAKVYCRQAGWVGVQ